MVLKAAEFSENEYSQMKFEAKLNNMELKVNPLDHISDLELN